MTHHDPRSLTDEELDVVAGGVDTEFEVGNLTMIITAGSGHYSITTIDSITGQSSTKVTHPHPC